MGTNKPQLTTQAAQHVRRTTEGELLGSSLATKHALICQRLSPQGRRGQRILRNRIDVGGRLLLLRYPRLPDDTPARRGIEHHPDDEQAGFDRALFENEVPKERWVDVSYPEALQSHAQRNNRAGHMMNLDSVVEHYRKEHVKDQELRMKRF